MSFLQALVLGIIQGLTEFLPISSSGHLVLVQSIYSRWYGLDLDGMLTFDILLHVGTLISVVLVFWKDLSGMFWEFFRMVKDLFKGKPDFGKNANRKMIALLFIAMIPMAFALLIKGKIESVLMFPLPVGIALLFTGVVLYITDAMPTGRKRTMDMKYKNALFVGVVQLFAVIPGLSRSGTTIFGGVFSGLDKKFAVKFSFLLSIATILGGMATDIKNIASVKTAEIAPTIGGMIAAAIVGIFAIKFLVALLNKGKYKYFSYYCWTVGILTIVLSIKGMI